MISPCVRDPDSDPIFGTLAAAGPRATEPGEYALIVESVREGYLLHYEHPRVVAGTDSDLTLLAGDYLYALGLERLAEIGDLEAVRELSDLITLSAQLHAERREREQTGALWLAAAIAVGCGAGPAHRRAKGLLRGGDPTAAVALGSAASAAAEEAGIASELGEAADAIDFALDLHS